MVRSPVSRPTTMWISNLKRLALTSAASLSLMGCGMAEGDQDDRNRLDYLEFSDPAFMNFCLERYDLNGDGRFSRYEAERILSLDCSSQGIRTIDEIEVFSRLEQLNCSKNAIERLDLSRCTRLEQLNCAENALYELTLDGLRSLEELDCHSNQLGRVDLSECGSLRWADLRANRFTTLDCSLCSTALQADVRANSQLSTVYYRAGQQINFESPTTLVERQ